MGTIKIDHDIPRPCALGRGQFPTLPLAEMCIGDSLFVPGVHGTQLRNRADAWARYHANGWKWQVRTESNGARLWRIK